MLLHAFARYFAYAELFCNGNQFAAVMVSNANFAANAVSSPARHEPAHHNRVIKQTQGDVATFGDIGDLCRKILFNCLLL